MRQFASRSVLTGIIVYFAVAFAWASLWHGIVDTISPGTLPIWFHLVDDIVFAVLTTILLYFLLARDEQRRREAEAARRAHDAERDRLLAAVEEQRNLYREQAVVARRQAAELDAVFSAMADGVLVYDADGNVVSANSAAIRLLGFDPLLGLPFSPTTGAGLADRTDEPSSPDRPDSLAQALIEQVAQSGESIKDHEVRFQRDDGCATIVISTVPIRDKDGCVARVLATFHDITERQRAAEELRQARDEMEARVKLRTMELALAYQSLEQRVDERTRELATLLEVSRQVASSRELQPTLDLVLDQLDAAIGFTSAAIFALEDDVLSVLSYRDRPADEQASAAKIPLALAPGLQAACHAREPLFVPDLQDDSALSRLYQGDPASLTRELLGNSRSWLGVPMVVKDRRVGLLRLAHKDPNVFTARHGRLSLALADQAAVAIENARLQRAAQEAAAMEERQRLARDLHDSVSQALFGIILGTKTLAEMLEPAQGRLAEALNFVLLQAQTALNETRALIIELGPESLNRQGLVAALTEYVAKVQANTSVAITASLCPEPDISLSVKETLYRVVQQALQNVVQHAGACQVQISLSCTAGEVILQVSDGGVGFNPDEVPPGHLGLRFMRERVERHGGTMEVESSPGRGTSITVRISSGDPA